MGSLNISRDPASQLGSAKSSFRLNQIDKIRTLGVGNHVSLPQIVVCGDQSAGKSSVLERLTEIPFPRQDGLCTRFATEIILRHTEGALEMVATIHADKSHDHERQRDLGAYRKNINDLADLPDIIDEVSSLIGLRGYGDSGGKAFSLDVLRIEVRGPTGLHLTIVDLPGLISVANEDQSDEDVRVVHRLVESYLESSRTIIMAVIQAGNDISNQPIVQKARKFDPDGLRTVGIITKPDLINGGTEHRIARLANNEDNVKLKLGFFLLKNPSPEDMASGMGPDALARDEADFFAQPCWHQCGIDPDRVGSAPLKTFMQELLQDHIEREIPKVKAELKTRLDDSELKLLRLGKPCDFCDGSPRALLLLDGGTTQGLEQGLEIEGRYTFVRAISTWSAGGDLLDFRSRLSLSAGVGRPVVARITPEPVGLPGWFGKETIHLAVLIPAWLYVLTFRWSTILCCDVVVEYTGSQAAWDTSEAPAEENGPAVVHLGSVDDGAAR